MRLVYLADAPYVHTRRWVEHFVEAGWETHVISFRPAEIAGATVHHIDGLERAGRLRYLAHTRRIGRLVTQLQPDILHALHLTSYGFLAATCQARPRLASVWGTDILEAPTWSPVHNAITRYALLKADHITATGFRLASATLPYAPRSKPITVTPYGVDTTRFHGSDERQSRGEAVIGSVGRLSKEKGLGSLLRATAQLIEHKTKLRLVLAGDGAERSGLESLAAELGIGANVEFRGHVAHDDVPAFLNELDIFVMPSLAEGFGVAALEAAAAGLPVVASRVHGIPDVVTDGLTGVLIPPGNVDALSAAIQELIASPELRTRMGAEGQAFVKAHYEWRENCGQMERLYRHILGSFTKPEAYGTVATS